MKLLTQLILGAAMLTSLSANANITKALGTLSTIDTTTFTNKVSGSFLDNYTFTLSSSSDTDYGGASYNIGSAINYAITGLDFKLYTSAASLLASGLSFSVNGLNSGDYYLTVSGTATGPKGGLYAGSIDATPVPEANTYAMMLAGLGLMGFVARRRRSS